MSNLTPNADHRFWGKARPTDPRGPDHHLLALHCLDVAAVADRYLQAAPRWLHWLGTELGTADSDDLRRWLVFWIALHDLGKFSLTFQAQCPHLLQRLQGSFTGVRDSERHDSLGAVWAEQHLLPLMLDEAWFPGADHDQLLPWLQAVTGHHGQPPKKELLGRLDDHFRRLHSDSALTFARQMRELLAPCAPVSSAMSPGQRLKISKQLSWWVAGLAVLCDWLGSNTRYFPYEVAPFALIDYWRRAQRQATNALAASGVLPGNQCAEQAFASLFPNIASPSPLQDYLSRLILQPGPQLHILEDVTGAGKTEAALMLTHRLMAQGQAQGFYVGLPTMATAHALYDRIRPLYQRLFGDSQPSLVLATGSAALVESFAQSVLPAPESAGGQPLREADTAEARCAHWLADHSKRALLAPAGIGTIDQALLAVLKGKHQSLRLLGL
ncbi:MAG: CRISPR-associated endonuclease Cas3'', partial [Rubrivivax sp.]|nr:CRISPR-associated endonuclease Cas3'' [Rubrivivax sp.]